MSIQWISIVASAITIVLLEALIFLSFIRRMSGLYLPQAAENRFFRFFTIEHVTVVAVVHTIFMVVVICGSLFLLW